MIKYKKASLEDYVFLFSNLKEEDKKEVLANGYTLKETVEATLKHTKRGIAAFKDDKLLCIFGYRQNGFLGGGAIVWLLGTKYFDATDYEIKREFLKQSKKTITKWRKKFFLLENYVDSEYEASIRWLKWLGFTIDEPAKNPVTGFYFNKVWMEGES